MTCKDKYMVIRSKIIQKLLQRRWIVGMDFVDEAPTKNKNQPLQKALWEWKYTAIGGMS